MSLPPGLSLVVPVYRNEENIDDLVKALDDFYQRYGERFEAVLVVDGSPDASWERLRLALSERRIPAQLVLLARNFGSFAAIRQGLSVANREIIAVMAADLQEPPELIDEFYDALAEDKADLAVGVRTERHDGRASSMLSGMFWGIFRRFVFSEVPPGGVDVFACNRKFRDALLSLEEQNTSLVAQLFWVGHRRIEVPYTRRPRTEGRSAWTMRRRFRYMLDSFFAFSDLPIMLLMWIGAIGVGVSLLVAVVVLIAWAAGQIDQPGYTPMILAVLFTGSMLMLGQGIVGAYVWRANENAKRRPLTIMAAHESFPDD